MKNTRLCFRSIQKRKFSFQSFPNFSLRQEKLSNPLPKNDSNTIFFVNKTLEQQILKTQKIQIQASKKICQLILLTKFKNKYLQCKTTTGYFLGFDKYIICATVLHLLKRQQHQQKQQPQIQQILINITSIDFAQRLQSLIIKWQKKDFKTQFNIFLKKNKGDIFILKNPILSNLTRSFLFFRKKYLKQLKHIRELMVPTLDLHALPSIDFLPLQLPQNLISLIINQCRYFKFEQYLIEGNSIQSQINKYKINIMKNEFVYMTGFQNTAQILDIYSQDYCLSLNKQNKQKQNKFLRENIDWMKKSIKKQRKQRQYNKMIDCKAIINPDKSVSICQVLDGTNNILVFKGNTLQGSSGSPLYTKDGVLIGMNFGYISDITEAYKFKESKKIFEFDIDLTAYQNKDSYRKQKNFNVALRLDSQVIRSWMIALPFLQVKSSF